MSNLSCFEPFASRFGFSYFGPPQGKGPILFEIIYLSFSLLQVQSLLACLFDKVVLNTKVDLKTRL